MTPIVFESETAKSVRLSLCLNVLNEGFQRFKQISQSKMVWFVMVKTSVSFHPLPLIINRVAEGLEPISATIQ